MKIKIDLLYEFLANTINNLTNQKHSLNIKSYAVKLIPKSLHSYFYRIIRKEYSIDTKDNNNNIISYFPCIIDFSSQVDTITYQEEEKILSDIISENEITQIIFSESKIPSSWKKAILDTLVEYSKEQKQRQRNIIYLNKEQEDLLDFTSDDFEDLNICVKTHVLKKEAIEN